MYINDFENWENTGQTIKHITKQLLNDQCICVTGRVYSWTASLARLSFQDLALRLHN